MGQEESFGLAFSSGDVCEVAASGTEGLSPTRAAQCWAVSVGTCQALQTCMSWEQTESPSNEGGTPAGSEHGMAFGREW